MTKRQMTKRQREL